MGPQPHTYGRGRGRFLGRGRTGVPPDPLRARATVRGRAAAQFLAPLRARATGSGPPRRRYPPDPPRGE
eukprot:gene20669-biopygen13114